MGGLDLGPLKTNSFPPLVFICINRLCNHLWLQALWNRRQGRDQRDDRHLPTVQCAVRSPDSERKPANFCRDQGHQVQRGRARGKGVFPWRASPPGKGRQTPHFSAGLLGSAKLRGLAVSPENWSWCRASARQIWGLGATKTTQLFALKRAGSVLGGQAGARHWEAPLGAVPKAARSPLWLPKDRRAAGAGSGLSCAFLGANHFGAAGHQ